MSPITIFSVLTSKLYLVFEFLDLDLKKYMDQIPPDGDGLGPDMVKRFTLQLISGIFLCNVPTDCRCAMVSFAPNSASRFETPKSAHRQRRKPQTSRLWSGTGLRRPITRVH